MTLKVITHFPKSDPRFYSDYYDIEIIDEAGNRIADFGDGYHDDGQPKMQGFIQGVEWALGKKVKVISENIADRDD